MLVKDIYGGSYGSLGLTGDLIASSFGKSATADKGDACIQGDVVFYGEYIKVALQHCFKYPSLAFFNGGCKSSTVSKETHSHRNKAQDDRLERMKTNFSWNPQICYMWTKLAKSDTLDHKSLHILYSPLVLPYLNYCMEVWGNTDKSSLHSFKEHSLFHFTRFEIYRFGQI